MINIIKTLAVVATMLTVSLCFLSCDSNSLYPIQDDAGITSIQGTWKVVSYEDYNNNVQTTQNSSNTWAWKNDDIILQFRDSIPTASQTEHIDTARTVEQLLCLHEHSKCSQQALSAGNRSTP